MVAVAEINSSSNNNNKSRSSKKAFEDRIFKD
jgi:hypothetical protein